MTSRRATDEAPLAPPGPGFRIEGRTDSNGGINGGCAGPRDGYVVRAVRPCLCFGGVAVGTPPDTRGPQECPEVEAVGTGDERKRRAQRPERAADGSERASSKSPPLH